MGWAVYITNTGQMRNVRKVLYGNFEEMRSHGRLKYLYDNIKNDAKDIRSEYMVWIHLAYDIFQWISHLNTAINYWVI